MDNTAIKVYYIKMLLKVVNLQYNSTEYLNNNVFAHGTVTN